nr:ribosomal-protein-serine acetyltransferase [uncultured bacterium]
MDAKRRGGGLSLQLPIAFPGGQLRRLRASDLAAFQAYRSIPELGRFQGWTPKPDAEAAAFLAAMGDVPLFPLGDWVQLGICDPGGELLVGDIGLFQAPDGLSGEVGFTLAPSAQGRGIATQAVHHALDLFFRLTRVERMLGITDARNVASVRLLERVGFAHRESRNVVFRDEECLEAIYVLDRAKWGQVQKLT